MKRGKHENIIHTHRLSQNSHHFYPIFCNENKEILSKNGVYFPIFEQKYKDVNPYRNGHFLIAHQYDSNGKINTLDEHRIFRFNMDHIIYMFSKYNNILLSDESIWHSATFFQKRFVGNFKKRIS